MNKLIAATCLALTVGSAGAAHAALTTRVKAAGAGIIGGAIVGGPVGAVVGGVGGAVVGNHIQKHGLGFHHHHRYYRHH